MPAIKGAVAPLSATTYTTFKDDIFKGKVLFCTGGGSGIGKQMTESIVSVVVYACRWPSELKIYMHCR